MTLLCQIQYKWSYSMRRMLWRLVGKLLELHLFKIEFPFCRVLIHLFIFPLNYYMSLYVFPWLLSFVLHFPHFGSFLSLFTFSLWLYINSFLSSRIISFHSSLPFSISGNGKKHISCETVWSYSIFHFSIYGLLWVVTFFHLMTNRHCLFALISSIINIPVNSESTAKWPTNQLTTNSMWKIRVVNSFPHGGSWWLTTEPITMYIFCGL
jgi:hypothetical protein